MSDKKMPSWDELTKDEKPAGMSPEMAKKLLAMNPALRDQGLSTDVVVKQSGGGATQETPGTQVKQSLLEAAAEQKTELDKIDQQIALLQRQREQAKQAAGRRITQWLLSNDPELLSPMTREALDKKKALFEAIGFDLQKFLRDRLK